MPAADRSGIEAAERATGDKSPRLRSDRIGRTLFMGAPEVTRGSSFEWSVW